MHLPDGFLSFPVTIATAATAVSGISLAIKKLKKKMADRLIPQMAVLAAFIFAAQMFNFPIGGGTSGHLLGALIAAVLLGPFAASIILTCVLIIQCLIFQDGGLLALGANITNMALIGVYSGYFVYIALRKTNDKIAIFVASWASVVSASFACASELFLSGTAPANVLFPAMIGIHAIIGMGEGIISIIVVEFVRRSEFKNFSSTQV